MALSTLSDLRTELQARAGASLADSRADQFLNDALAELYDTASWYFLEDTTTGTAPLAISDVRQVLSVFDNSSLNELVPLPYRDILELDPTQVQSGSPQYWALDGTTVRVWPLNTADTISVRYLKVPAALSADSDTTLLPDRYVALVVDLAQVRMLSLARSNENEAAALRAEVDRKVGLMVQNLAHRNYDFPLVQRVYDNSETVGWWW